MVISKNIKYCIIACILALTLLIAGCTTTERTTDAEINIKSEVTKDLLYFGNPVVEGEFVTVDVLAKGLSPMSGVQMGIAFDPSYLVYDSATEGDFLKQGGANTLFFDLKKFPQEGLVKDIVLARQGGDVTGDGLVAKVKFKIIQKGTSTIDFEEVIVADMKSQKVPVSTKSFEVIVS